VVRADRSLLEQAGLASGLLTEEQLDHAWAHLAEVLPGTGVSLDEISDLRLAEYLVELKHLNLWQAEQLRQGRTKFTLGVYRIVDAIGHGGMGWVFKGEHELLGRVEAIKVLPKSQMTPTSIENFRREIRAQAKLNHPNLVRLSYADKEGDTYFLVTEFVPGSDMRRLVHYHGAMSQQKAALLVSQAASALEHAHGQGMIHRDVKPGNILITPTGHAKLTDLGLAFFSDDPAETSQLKPKHIVGTADFLAPEIIVTPSEVRSVSDIYSLGCTLYYAVTGKVPFPGGDTADKLRRHLDELPISPCRLNPNVDPRFAEVIAAMMHKRPEQRISTAAEVTKLLKPWLPPEDTTTWEEIDEVIDRPVAIPHDETALAETIPARHDAEESKVQKKVPAAGAERQPPQLTRSQQTVHDSQAVPSVLPPAPESMNRDTLTSDGMSRATSLLLLAAFVVAVVAIYVVLSGIE